MGLQTGELPISTRKVGFSIGTAAINDLILPFYLQEGDCHYQNVFLNSSTSSYVILDFDFLGLHPLCFDLVMLLSSDFHDNPDSQPCLSAFLRGDHDSLFSSVYQSLGLSFSPKDRDKLLAVSLCENFQRFASDHLDLKKVCIEQVVQVCSLCNSEKTPYCRGLYQKAVSDLLLKTTD